MKLIRIMLCLLLVASCRRGLADSILVGPNLSQPVETGLELCLEAICNEYAEEVTFTQAVEIQEVQFILVSDSINGVLNGPVNLYLAPSLGDFGAGTPLAAVTTSYTVGYGQTESFDVQNLDIQVAAGTYWIEIGSTSDSVIDLAPPVAGTPGTIDAFAQCNNPDEAVGDQCELPFWHYNDPSPAYFDNRQLAIDLDGIALTPEPPTWMLFGTGLVALFGLARRRQNNMRLPCRQI
jgi:hypothetical protein